MLLLGKEKELGAQGEHSPQAASPCISHTGWHPCRRKAISGGVTLGKPPLPKHTLWVDLAHGASDKESAWQCSWHKRCGFEPWIWKICWRRQWQPTPVFLPGKSHGQSSLAGYSPREHEESDTTEHTHTLEWEQAKGSAFLCGREETGAG